MKGKLLLRAFVLIAVAGPLLIATVAPQASTGFAGHATHSYKGKNQTDAPGQDIQLGGRLLYTAHAASCAPGKAISIKLSTVDFTGIGLSDGSIFHAHGSNAVNEHPSTGSPCDQGYPVQIPIPFYTRNASAPGCQKADFCDLVIRTYVQVSRSGPKLNLALSVFNECIADSSHACTPLTGPSSRTTVATGLGLVLLAAVGAVALRRRRIADAA